MFNFKQEFNQIIAIEKPSWEMTGLITSNKKIFTLGSDTKVLSTIFELLCRPFIIKIAQKHGYQMKEAPQTIYPDFTLLKTEDDKHKIAIDVKTTYRLSLIHI